MPCGRMTPEVKSPKEGWRQGLLLLGPIWHGLRELESEQPGGQVGVPRRSCTQSTVSLRPQVLLHMSRVLPWIQRGDVPLVPNETKQHH